jgi:hypothetical protein
MPLPGVTAAEMPPPIEVRFHAFPNDLGLYHVRVEEATSFKLSATVWVGWRDEDSKVNGGVSHLLEHILFHQPDMPEVAFDAQIESRGGTSNGETSFDATKYYVTLPARDLNLGQSWLHKVLFRDRLVTDRLEQEKEIVSREEQWSTPTWGERLFNLFQVEYQEIPGLSERPSLEFPGFNVYPGHTDEGAREVARGLTADQLMMYYQAHYYPENMVLLYVGPHEFGDVIAALGPTFGSVQPTGRETQVASILEGVTPHPYFRYDLPDLFSAPEYKIEIGHVFSELRPSPNPEFFLYRNLIEGLLEEHLRYRKGSIYNVWMDNAYYRGRGDLTFTLHPDRDSYWTVLEEAKNLVWGDLGEYLSQKDYERYKTELLERSASRRGIYHVHDVIWRSIKDHPLHRPSPEETDRYGPLHSLSYEDFLAWVRTWRSMNAPMLQLLPMPTLPFPHAHLLLFLLAMAFGANFFNIALGPYLRRRFPRDNIKLMTRVPYGIMGWVQLGVFYVAAALLASACIEGGLGIILYPFEQFWSGSFHFRRIHSLAMVYPYLEPTFDGLYFGLVIALGGLVMPRTILVTDRSLLVKMRSRLFFRIPLEDIKDVEAIYGWAAWRRIVTLKARPVYPWFVRGLLIHRKSGRAIVLHTKDDQVLYELLFSQAYFGAATSMATAESPSESEALVTN